MNLDTALRICGPAMIAMMIFAVSPGRYGITPTPSPATKLIPSWPASHAVADCHTEDHADHMHIDLCRELLNEEADDRCKEDKTDEISAGRSEKLADTAGKSGEYRKSYGSQEQI